MYKKSLLLIVFLFFVSILFSIGSVETSAASDMKPLQTSNGTYVYYKGTQDNVMIPTSFKQQDTYLRSVWVTPLAGNIESYRNDDQYKAEILEVFDVMEHFNLNALFFHIRIMNDALYPSKLNPTSNYLNANWDVLEWIIEECHKRGFEFHAWMNPYRVKASGGGTAKEEAAIIKSKCSANVGSDPNNLIVSKKGGVILNPGLEVVRQFIVDTCMEVIENYDVDAIHFDDYFYISDIDDSALYNASNPNNLSLSDWRREQVNLFIEKLSDTMRAYNKENNRHVQLGISPTGIYRNGDGVVTYDEEGNAISSGSKTGGQEHFESYLFSDTLKWINEEWIDYITPQSYWAFTHTIAGYADVMGWWNKVVKYKNVNLYSGMGIYMSQNPGSNYSWGYDPHESFNQIMYATTLENCAGTVFYNYDYLLSTYKGNTGGLYNTGLNKIKAELWTNPSILPEINTMEPVYLNAPTDMTAKANGDNITIKFRNVEDAKFYIVYRSEKDITYAPEEVYDIIYPGDEDFVSFTDKVGSKEYNYAIKTQSGTNHLSKNALSIELVELTVTFKDANGNVLKTEVVKYGHSATGPSVPNQSEFVGWSKDISAVTSDLEVTARYKDSDFFVNFYDAEGKIVATEKTKYEGTVTAPVVDRTGYDFVSWDIDFSKVIYDLDVKPIYKEKEFNIKFVDLEGNVLDEVVVKYGKTCTYPTAPTVDRYTFKEWSVPQGTPFTEAVVVTPVYEPILHTVTFINKLTDEVIDVQQVLHKDDAVAPVAPSMIGYEFTRWSRDFTNILADATVYAVYSEVYYVVTFVGLNDEVISTVDYFQGDKISYPDAPEIENYEFEKWDEIPEVIGSDITIKAYYKKLIIKVDYVYNGEVIFTEYVENGKDATFDFDVPEIEGMKFNGFDSEGKNLTEDVEITLIYVERSGCFNKSTYVSLVSLISLVALASFALRKFLYKK